MKKIVIPIALLFAGLKVSAQSSDQRKFSFIMTIKSPSTLTFNDADRAQAYALFDVKGFATNGDVAAITDGGANYALPTITATQPFELRADLANASWTKNSGGNSNIGCTSNDRKSIAVELVMGAIAGTVAGEDMMIEKAAVRLSPNAPVLLAHTDKPTTSAKGVTTQYKLVPKGIKIDDLKEHLTMVVNYVLVAK